MKRINSQIKNNGFALISAVFILVILSLVGTYIINLAAVQTMTATYSLQGTRAYYAAKSGLEWGVYQVVNNANSCPAATTLNFTQGGLNNFNVQVSCNLSNYIEGSTNYNVFRITAFSQQGSYGSTDYTSRKLDVIVTKGT